MSKLGSLEIAMVARLASATIGGNRAFQVVRGISGGYRAAVRDALRRERMPAAYVAFTEEPTAPETKLAVRGARFVVLVPERVLRVDSDPRHGDVSSPGVFALLEAARARLDNYLPISGVRLESLQVKFVDADERTAVYELLYRARPITLAKLAPGPPVSLVAFTDVLQRAVRLAWTLPSESDTAGAPDYCRVYRKRPSDAQFILQDTASRGETGKNLPAQPTGLTLQYYVTAANEGGEGPPSNTVMVMV